MRILMASLAVALLAGCGSVPTNDAAPGSEVKNYDRSLYEKTSTASTSLYERLGGREVIYAFVDEGIDLSANNPVIAHHFETTDLATLKDQLTDQICELAGGPCVYEGMSMEDAHRDLDIRESGFIALVEDMQTAMRNQGVPFRLENQVLALLAPMKPAVIER
jgi:hemoglobin